MLVDFEQIQKAKAGDDAAFNQVVVAYRKRILGTIARLIGRVVQERTLVHIPLVCGVSVCVYPDQTA